MRPIAWVGLRLLNSRLLSAALMQHPAAEPAVEPGAAWPAPAAWASENIGSRKRPRSRESRAPAANAYRRHHRRRSLGIEDWDFEIRAKVTSCRSRKGRIEGRR